MINFYKLLLNHKINDGEKMTRKMKVILIVALCFLLPIGVFVVFPALEKERIATEVEMERLRTEMFAQKAQDSLSFFQKLRENSVIVEVKDTAFQKANGLFGGDKLTIIVQRDSVKYKLDIWTYFPEIDQYPDGEYRFPYGKYWKKFDVRPDKSYEDLWSEFQPGETLYILTTDPLSPTQMNCVPHQKILRIYKDIPHRDLIFPELN